MDVLSRIMQTKALRITLHFESGKRRCRFAANGWRYAPHAFAGYWWVGLGTIPAFPRDETTPV
jgi:hypothetical protein